jgi:hypothetical protein
MTAKAANRLPLTPKLKPLVCDLDRADISHCPVYATLRCFLARQYLGTRLTSPEADGFLPHFWWRSATFGGFSVNLKGGPK